MFTFRCFPTRFLARSLISCRYRQLSSSAAHPDPITEQCQSTISLIKQDLLVIHRDTLQVSNHRSIHIFDSFRFRSIFL